MSLKRFRAFVNLIAANLAREIDIQSMQLVQPVWNWLKQSRWTHGLNATSALTFPSHPNGKFFGL